MSKTMYLLSPYSSNERNLFRVNMSGRFDLSYFCVSMIKSHILSALSGYRRGHAESCTAQGIRTCWERNRSYPTSDGACFCDIFLVRITRPNLIISFLSTV